MIFVVKLDRTMPRIPHHSCCLSVACKHLDEAVVATVLAHVMGDDAST